MMSKGEENFTHELSKDLVEGDFAEQGTINRCAADPEVPSKSDLSIGDYSEVHIKIRLCKTMNQHKRVEVIINGETYYPCNPDLGFNMEINEVHCYSLPPRNRGKLFSVPYDCENENLHILAVIIDQDFDLTVQLNGNLFGFNAGGGLLEYSASFNDQNILLEIMSEIAGDNNNRYSFAR